MSRNPFTKPKKGKTVFDPRLGEEPKPNKFGAKQTTCAAGHGHASRKEARRCNDLHLLERAGEIMALKQQPKFFFVVDGRAVTGDGGRQVFYTADFSYLEPAKKPAGSLVVVEHDGKKLIHVVEDVKGPYRNDTWKLRKAFFRACFPQYELREV